jgi:hypothetical protein
VRRWRVEQQACHGQSSLQRDEGVVGRFRAARRFEPANKRAGATICVPDGHLSKSTWYQKALGIEKSLGIEKTLGHRQNELIAPVGRNSAGLHRTPRAMRTLLIGSSVGYRFVTVSTLIVDHGGDEGARAGGH